MHVRVSLFLRDKVQNPNGRFVVSRGGLVPHGGREVKRVHFPSGGSYSGQAREGSFSLHGDRVTRLGTNMYCESQPEDTHATGRRTDDAPTPRPNPLASEELNLLARLIGALEVLERPGGDAGPRVDLFSDARARSELARIAEEFQDQDRPTEEPCISGRSTAGDDLLALMDTTSNV
ncbi:hypothetical protein NHX12_023977 [Muraenolepis orangiensis]|uniref:Uncharacterized protein n=1 Tax=Muraenolepis orangiensis TaxID=630683 RepID=A0A9Q0EM24_9TELE|nr:hypothetical protein NHX12_023977 [Muraenolepis orangiensis]